MSASLEVVAVGARTPVGYTAESSAAAVRAGISRYAEYPFADAQGEPVVIASDGLLDPKLEGRERLLPLLESALDEVEAKLGPEALQRGRLSVLLSCPEVRPGFSEEDEGWLVNAVEARYRGKGSGACIVLAGRGHAGALRAVEQALRECADGRDHLFLVAGADSYHHTETFLWLEQARRFAQPGIRNGFTPGEGAGCLALMSAGTRRRLGLPRLAVVRGAHTSRECQLRDSSTGSFGVGMTQAVEGAVMGLELPREGVDDLYTDINGERYRSEEWGFVVLRTPSVWKSTGYRAPSSCWGDVGAASGALGGVLAVRAFARGYARGPRAMVIAGSDGGLRGAMLLQEPRVP
jgi:3-oxoacyl-[acyl-carrier-protein] synthase-1